MKTFTEGVVVAQNLLAVIDRDELKDLLYGEVLTADQEAALRLIAEETGTDVELLRPATRAPEIETAAEQASAAEIAEQQREAARAAQTPQDEAEVDDDIAQIYSDLIAVLGSSARRVVSRLTSLRAVRTLLWNRGIDRAELREDAARRRSNYATAA